MLAMISLPPPENDCQQTINDCSSYIMDTQRGVHRRRLIINAAAACMGYNAPDDIGTTSYR